MEAACNRVVKKKSEGAKFVLRATIAHEERNCSRLLAACLWLEVVEAHAT